MDSRMPILHVKDLQSFYGQSHVLHGVNLEVYDGEVVTLLGRNGAGKSTALKSIIGMIGKREGSVTLRGEELIAMLSYRIARLGIGYCPEDRGIFASLTVEENLMLPPIISPGGMSESEIHHLFPNLLERRYSRGNKLSGGEQQMLAIGRLLRTGAKLLLLDEPTEGIAPVLVNQIGTALRGLKQLGFTILLVEQNIEFASSIADRHYIVEDGRVIDEIANAEFSASREKLKVYLGI